ncbi:MAG TPA: glycerol-3-phosphate 1-O-acyltransferase PlsY [Opitutaceae bacterium]|nr:glycerol-3-phosphate 1-O-acyltransferase PlsY [Opitutaceae bacterium]
MMLSVLKVLLGYLLGSVSGSLLLGRLRGVDIRTMGSGNAGGTNAFRTQGAWFALGVGIVDIGKSALAVALARQGESDPARVLLLGLLAGAAAVAGHVWPLYHGFRGGKGVAALFGALLVLWPAGFGVVVGVILLTLMTTGYVGLGSMLGGLALIPAVMLLQPPGPRETWLAAAVVIAAFVIFTHRANLARLRAGTEHRFERARLLWRLVRPRSAPE